jgi:hypothetical protein
MNCPYKPNTQCSYIDTAGMDKLKHCPVCENYHIPNIQYITWRTWHGIRFVKGFPLLYPESFHLIYKWSIFIGWLEIRKFLTAPEQAQAVNMFTSILEVQSVSEFDRLKIKRFMKMSTRKLRKLNSADGRLYNGPELTRYELIYQLTFYRDAPTL